MSSPTLLGLLLPATGWFVWLLGGMLSRKPAALSKTVLPNAKASAPSPRQAAGSKQRAAWGAAAAPPTAAAAEAVMEQDQAFSSFPAPPGFYRLYQAGADAGPPPPEPVTGNILALGEAFDTAEPFCPPLEMRKLYSVEPDGSVDIRRELLVLNKGLLFLFLELLQVLVQQPSAFSAVLSQLNVTLHNMAHLVNLARPLQAQQTLAYVLQSQVQDKRAALEALKSKTARIKQDIMSVSEQLAAVGGDAAESLPQPAQAAAAAAAMEEG